MLDKRGGDFAKLKMNLISKEENMEKSKKKYGLLGLLALVLIVPLAFILTACCGSLPYDVGTYVGTVRHAGGTDQPLTGTGTILVLEDDYTGYLAMQGQKFTFEFTMSGEDMVFTIDYPDGTRECPATIENGKISLTLASGTSPDVWEFEYDADYSQADLIKYGRYNASKVIMGEDEFDTTDEQSGYITLNENNTGTFSMPGNAERDVPDQFYTFTYTVASDGNTTIITIVSTVTSGDEPTTGMLTGEYNAKTEIVTLDLGQTGGGEYSMEYTYVG